MTKEMAKNIALALIAKSGEQFDTFAFEDSNISEKDKEKIANEIQYQCSKIIAKVEAKYNKRLGNTTAEIIDDIICV